MTRVLQSTPWCLEGFVDDRKDVWRTMIHKIPFLVGRNSRCDLVLHSGLVSSRHAELKERHDTLWVSDLDSTNGTFLNGQRIMAEGPLKDGDLLRFADREFRLISLEDVPSFTATQTVRIDVGEIAAHLDRDVFRQMVLENRTRILFQPLVSLAGGEVLGYEALGRGDLGGAEAQPADLFQMAETLRMEAQLSSAFRQKSLEESGELAAGMKIFLNTHPRELEDSDRLLSSLRGLRQGHPDRPLILELHEAAVANLEALVALGSELETLDIGIAFDDFGNGQDRLLALCEAAPQYVKFDRAWIRDARRVTPSRLDMVRALVEQFSKMGIETIAEGIEHAEEARLCTDLGFDYAQGFHFGRPSPAELWLSRGER